MTYVIGKLGKNFTWKLWVSNYLFILKLQTFNTYTCPEAFTEQFLNVLLENLMYIELFQICTLKINNFETYRSIILKFCMVSIFKAELILQAFRRFTYVTAHFPTLPSLHLRHSSFSKPSVALPTSQLILQPFRRFTYITAHSTTLRCFTYVTTHSPQSSFSNLSVTSPSSQLILQPFRRFTYVTAHSPTLPLLHLRHSSFSNPSLASPKSQALHLRHLASRSCWWHITHENFGLQTIYNFFRVCYKI